MKKIVILENVRSTHNVGSVFRTSAAFDVSKIFLVGITPTPLDAFGRRREDIEKVALGAVDMVGWEHRESVEDVVNILGDDVDIVSVEQGNGAMNYKDYVQERDAAYIFGSEVGGVSDRALKLSTKVIEIPLKGGKESLNISVAFGIVIAEV